MGSTKEKIAMPDDVKQEGNPGEEFDSDLMPLIERAVAPDNTIDLKLIAPGWGASGYYSADVLREDGPAAWPAGTHMYLDHPTESESRERPERSVKDLAAVTISSPVFQEDGKAGPGLYAKATVLPQYKDVIEALAPHIGVSIRAKGSFAPGMAEGREGRVISKIAKGESIDFVTRPGAGGKVLALMESLRVRQNESADVVSSNPMTAEANNFVQTEAATSGLTTVTTTTSDAATIHFPVASEAAADVQHEEDNDMELSEAQERISTLETELEESKTTAQEATARAERAEGALAILEAQRLAGEYLVNVSLPSAAKQRVISKVTADPQMTDGKIDADALKEAVEAESKVEADYIESITGVGTITDQGTQSAQPKDDGVVRESLSSNLSKFFNLTPDAAQKAVDGR
jgi:hypothetical protein